MRKFHVRLHDGTSAETARPCAYALAFDNITCDDEGMHHDHRVLSWHDSLAEARYYERLGGETYIVPVTEVTTPDLH